MTLNEVVEQLRLHVRCGGPRLQEEVTGGYAGDLLSDVMAHSKPGDLWVTLQVHANIVAVAVLKDLAGIVIVQGREPAEETLTRAAQENVPLLVSDLQAFETIGKISAMIGNSP